VSSEYNEDNPLWGTLTPAIQIGTEMGTLYLVATPIGNLEDISQRALRVLSEATLIAAEDTRVALPMLKRYAIQTRVISYHDDSSASRLNEIVATLKNGDVAVVSDAGMPGISDPGSMLVRAALEAGHTIIPIPGPSAVIAAAAASGTCDQGFVFAGFLPRQSGARNRRLQELATSGLPLILFEAPGRVERLLFDIASLFPEAQVTVGREITKLHEEWHRGSPSDVAAQINPRGEFVLVVEPRKSPDADDDLLEQTLNGAMDSGVSLREAVDRAIGATGLGRKQVYARALEIQRERSGS
jgi:16S rRNA (cytidine1402-2'-O)-methyltransferase